MIVQVWEKTKEIEVVDDLKYVYHQDFEETSSKFAKNIYHSAFDQCRSQISSYPVRKLYEEYADIKKAKKITNVVFIGEEGRIIDECLSQSDKRVNYYTNLSEKKQKDLEELTDNIRKIRNASIFKLIFWKITKRWPETSNEIYLQKWQNLIKGE